MSWQDSFKIGLPVYIGIIKQFIASDFSDSETISVREVLQKNIREEKLTKLKTKEYQKDGLYPIVDQGKRFICGYTDNKSILFSENLPVVIFGDHTRNLKFIDFPFAIGADGTKILKPVKQISEKFFYYSLFDFKHSERGYSRYFKQLANHFLTIPFFNDEEKSLDYQLSIVAFLDELEENALDKTKTHFGKQIEEKIISLQNFIQNRKTLSTELNHQLALVKELRQAYLREAMQGKLVRQDSTDEPAEILLEKIKAEKEKLVAEKRIRRDKPLPPINAEEIPFEIPSNWTWCRLGEIAYLAGRIGWKGLTASEYTQEGALFLSVHSLNYGDYVNLDEAFHISDKRYEESPEIILENGDILICKDGAGIGKLGVVQNLNERATINSSLLIIRVERLNHKFIYYYLLSSHFQKIVMSRIMGATTPHLYQRDLVSFFVALPPLAEQERIVAKLEKLMKFCDELEANIRQGIANADQLLQTALKEALEPR